MADIILQTWSIFESAIKKKQNDASPGMPLTSKTNEISNGLNSESGVQNKTEKVSKALENETIKANNELSENDSRNIEVNQGVPQFCGTKAAKVILANGSSPMPNNCSLKNKKRKKTHDGPENSAKCKKVETISDVSNKTSTKCSFNWESAILSILSKKHQKNENGLKIKILSRKLIKM